jgi:integrase
MAQLSCFEDDEWFWKKGRQNKIIFSHIHSFKIKKAIKTYAWYFLSISKANTKGSVVYKLKLFIEFLKKNNITELKNFTNKEKNYFYLYLDDLLKNGSSPGTIKDCLKTYRSFFKYLKNIRYEDLCKNLMISSTEYKVRVHEKESRVYTDEEMAKILDISLNHSNRLIGAYMGIQALTGRRTSEMILGLEKDCIFSLGGVTHMRWLNLKNQSTQVTPLLFFEIIKESNDINSLVPKLVEEVLQITNEYRSLASIEYKNLLFLQKFSKNKNRYYDVGPMSKASIRKEILKIKKEYKLPDLRQHDFRHTIITKMIRLGLSIEVVGKIIGDQPQTLRRHYEGEMTRIDTLKLERTSLVEPLDEARKQLDYRKLGKPILIGKSTANLYTQQKVPGGICTALIDEMYLCPSYNLFWGKGGCKGCSNLGVSRDNLFFWEQIYKIESNKLDNLRNTPLHSAILKEMKKTEWIVNKLKNLEAQ